jgi:pimeloyl-ACP methyl ester carboxylesterase
VYSVLLSFLSTFLRREYHVIAYNSRGVGNSGGSPSWTGFSEANDLQVVVDLALREIEAVDEIVLLVRV